MKDSRWPQLIGGMVLLKQQLAAVDGGLWPHHLPGVRASESDVVRTEELLGVSLPEDYRSFLLHADGWPGFFQTIDLLGCSSLVQGEHLRRFYDQYGALSPVEWQEMDLHSEGFIPIGVSLEDSDVVVISVGADRADVAWVAGGLIERWQSFHEFFIAMLAYTRREVGMCSH